MGCGSSVNVPIETTTKEKLVVEKLVAELTNRGYIINVTKPEIIHRTEITEEHIHPNAEVEIRTEYVLMPYNGMCPKNTKQYTVEDLVLDKPSGSIDEYRERIAVLEQTLRLLQLVIRDQLLGDSDPMDELKMKQALNHMVVIWQRLHDYDRALGGTRKSALPSDDYEPKRAIDEMYNRLVGIKQELTPKRLLTELSDFLAKFGERETWVPGWQIRMNGLSVEARQAKRLIDKKNEHTQKIREMRQEERTALNAHLEHIMLHQANAYTDYEVGSVDTPDPDTDPFRPSSQLTTRGIELVPDENADVGE